MTRFRYAERGRAACGTYRGGTYGECFTDRFNTRKADAIALEPRRVSPCIWQGLDVFGDDEDE